MKRLIWSCAALLSCVAMGGVGRILRSTHPLFTAAVREAIVQAQFIPAELHGVKVRQLVQAPFVFNIPR